MKRRPRNPHEVLGVPKDADESEIKAAYRKLALRFHPDLMHGDAAKFIRIKEAYETVLRMRNASEHPYGINGENPRNGFTIRSQPVRGRPTSRAVAVWGIGLAFGCVMFGGALLFCRTGMFDSNLHRKGVTRAIQPTSDVAKRERIAKILLQNSRTPEE